MEYSLVTGATGVLGKEFCSQLSSENLIITGRNKDRLQELSKTLNENTKYIACDLSRIEDTKRLIDELSELNVQITSLYYIAGQDNQKAFSKFSYQEIINMNNVNYLSCLLLTRYLLEKGCKKYLICSSLTGITPMPYFAEYSSTKGALISFFKSFKKENKDCKVTILMPGSIPTREDIKKDIQKQGLQGRLSSKSSEYVTKTALKYLQKNILQCVPGMYNKVVRIMSYITPFSISSGVVIKKMKNKEKNFYNEGDK